MGLSLEEVARLDPARWRPDWAVLGAASLALLAGYLLSGLLWGRMVTELGGPRISPGASCRVYFLANLGRYVPGKIWQIAGVAYLSREAGVRASLGTAAAVLGQGMALAGATLVGSGAFLAGGQRMRTLGVWALTAAGLLVIGVAVPPLFRRGMDLWFRLLRQEPPSGPDPGPGFGPRWLALYTLNWAVYAGSFWGLARAFGVGGGPVALASAFAAAYVLGYVAFFAPAGLGVREGFLVALLQPLGVGAGAAAALAVLARLWMTLVELVPALVVWGRGSGGSMHPREGGDVDGGEGAA